MKKLLIIATLFFSIASFAQIALEHSYPDNPINRIVLDYSGEKYYQIDTPNHQLIFYNADHSPWKIIVLPVPEQTYNINIQHVSEAKINPDTDIEVAYTTASYTQPYYNGKVVNESGAVLLDAGLVLNLRLSEFTGLPTKILASTPAPLNGKVFSVPELTLEHNYSEGEVKRVVLESSGEKYYVLDRDNNVINVYNADYSFWKAIPITKPDGYVYSSVITIFSDHEVNTDDLIDVGYTYYLQSANYVYESKIINENGITLLTVPNTNSFRVSAIDGFPVKIMADRHDFTTGDLVQETKIFSTPALELEHLYEGAIARTVLENSGEKYYPATPIPTATEIVVYNSDHSPWKTISIPLPETYYRQVGIFHLSQTKIIADDKIELIYCYETDILGAYQYTAKVINEDGIVLADIPGAAPLYFSEFPGLENKFIGNIVWPTGEVVYAYAGNVYNIGIFAGIDDLNQFQATVFPNPAAADINISTEGALIKEVLIYDLLGKRISHLKAANITKIDVSNYTDGLYLLHLTDANNKKSIQKIIVSH